MNYKNITIVNPWKLISTNKEQDPNSFFFFRSWECEITYQSKKYRLRMTLDSNYTYVYFHQYNDTHRGREWEIWCGPAKAVERIKVKSLKYLDDHPIHFRESQHLIYPIRGNKYKTLHR